MKKIIMASAIIMALASCSGSGSGSSNESVGDTVEAYDDISGVQNANGNIPDTLNTGATPRTDKPPIDSVTADTLPR